eukprot:TRINITY_DN11929_c0_g2_i3.p1 TRINITY_DN11929_c0_g2~~TRINITY_DN11929_c0_g2_i3.p1  ORF type:complete len:824 (+),score=205.64 TRINITY_DN11929_c0_g2_i3:84-2555(+)
MSQEARKTVVENSKAIDFRKRPLPIVVDDPDEYISRRRRSDRAGIEIPDDDAPVILIPRSRNLSTFDGALAAIQSHQQAIFIDSQEQDIAPTPPPAATHQASSTLERSLSSALPLKPIPAPAAAWQNNDDVEIVSVAPPAKRVATAPPATAAALEPFVQPRPVRAAAQRLQPSPPPAAAVAFAPAVVRPVPVQPTQAAPPLTAQAGPPQAAPAVPPALPTTPQQPIPGVAAAPSAVHSSAAAARPNIAVEIRNSLREVFPRLDAPCVDQLVRKYSGYADGVDLALDAAADIHSWELPPQETTTVADDKAVPHQQQQQQLQKPLVAGFDSSAYFYEMVEKQRSTTAARAASASGGKSASTTTPVRPLSGPDYFAEQTSFEWRTPEYLQICVDQLMRDYPTLTKASVADAMRACNSCYAPTWKYLRKLLADGSRQLKFLKQQRQKFPTVEVSRDARFADELRAVHHLLEQERLQQEAVHAEQEDRHLAEKLNREEQEAGDLLSCGCCYSDYPFEQMSQCNEGCLFCRSCIQSYAGTAIFGEGKLELKCMSTDGACTGIFPPAVLRACLEAKAWERYTERLQEESLLSANVDIVRCYACHDGYELEADVPELHCPKCNKKTCRLCKKEVHPGLRCDQVEAGQSMRLSVEEEMTRALVRTCLKCKVEFFKEEGCNKMTCRCGAIQCYLCKSDISKANYTHFCQTPHCEHKTCKKCILFTDSIQQDAQAVRDAAIRKEQEFKQKHAQLADLEVATKLVPVVPPARQPPQAAAVAPVHVIPVVQPARGRVGFADPMFQYAQQQMNAVLHQRQAQAAMVRRIAAAAARRR